MSCEPRVALAGADPGKLEKFGISPAPPVRAKLRCGLRPISRSRAPPVDIPPSSRLPLIEAAPSQACMAVVKEEEQPVQLGAPVASTSQLPSASDVKVRSLPS